MQPITVRKSVLLFSDQLSMVPELLKVIDWLVVIDWLIDGLVSTVCMKTYFQKSFVSPGMADKIEDEN